MFDVADLQLGARGGDEPTRASSAMTSSDSSVSLVDLVERAQAAERAGEWDDAVAVWRTLLALPRPELSLLDYEILEEIHQVLRRAGRHDEAIAAKREAIAAGYRSTPDAEADIAEILVAAGRRDEADALYAELRRRDPDDVWLDQPTPTPAMPLALAWFPAEQWPLALQRWPDLTDYLPADHAAYSRRIEGPLEVARQGPARPSSEHRPAHRRRARRRRRRPSRQRRSTRRARRPHSPAGPHRRVAAPTQ